MENNGIYESQPYTNNDFEKEPKGHKGLAITSLVLGILSLVLCCCVGFSFVLSIPALILGIITLAKKYDGKGMAIAGVILSAISVLLTTLILIVYGPVMSDVIKFSTDYPQNVETYQETGELPEYLEKYTDEKYDEVWKQAGYDDFYEYFDAIILEMEKSAAEAQE